MEDEKEGRVPEYRVDLCGVSDVEVPLQVAQLFGKAFAEAAHAGHFAPDFALECDEEGGSLTLIAPVKHWDSRELFLTAVIEALAVELHDAATEPLLSVAQAAKELGVGRKDVQKLIYEGQLIAQKVGNVFVIRPRDIFAIRNVPEMSSAVTPETHPAKSLLDSGALLGSRGEDLFDRWRRGTLAPQEAAAELFQLYHMAQEIFASYRGLDAISARMSEFAQADATMRQTTTIGDTNGSILRAQAQAIAATKQKLQNLLEDSEVSSAEMLLLAVLMDLNLAMTAILLSEAQQGEEAVSRWQAFGKTVQGFRVAWVEIERFLAAL